MITYSKIIVEDKLTLSEVGAYQDRTVIKVVKPKKISVRRSRYTDFKDIVFK